MSEVLKVSNVAGTNPYVVLGNDYFYSIAQAYAQSTPNYGQILEDVVLDVLKSQYAGWDTAQNLNPSESGLESETNFPFADIYQKIGSVPVLYSVKSSNRPMVGTFSIERKKLIKGLEIGHALKSQTDIDAGPKDTPTPVWPGLIVIKFNANKTNNINVAPIGINLTQTGLAQTATYADADPNDPGSKPVTRAFVPGFWFEVTILQPNQNTTKFQIDDLKTSGKSTISITPGTQGAVKVSRTTKKGKRKIIQLKKTTDFNEWIKGPQATSIETFQNYFMNGNATEIKFNMIVSPAPTKNTFDLIKTGNLRLLDKNYHDALNLVKVLMDKQIKAATRDKPDTDQKRGLRDAASDIFVDNALKVTLITPTATIDQKIIDKLNDPNKNLNQSDYSAIGTALLSYHDQLQQLNEANLKALITSQQASTDPTVLARTPDATSIVPPESNIRKGTTGPSFVVATQILKMLESLEDLAFVAANTIFVDDSNNVYIDAAQIQILTMKSIETQKKLNPKLRLVPESIMRSIYKLMKESPANSDANQALDNFFLQLIKLFESVGESVADTMRKGYPESDYEFYVDLQTDLSEISVSFDQQFDQQAERELKMYTDIKEPVDYQVTDGPQGEFDFQTPDSPALKFEGRKRMRHSLLDLLEEQMMAPMPALGGGSAPLDSRVIDDPFDLDLETQSLLGLTRADEVDIDEDSVDSDFDGVPNELDADDDTPQIDTMIAERFMQDLLRNEKRVRNERSNFEVGESHATKLKKKYYGRY